MNERPARFRPTLPVPAALWFFFAGEVVYVGYHFVLAQGLRFFASHYPERVRIWVESAPELRSSGAGFWIYFVMAAICLALLASRSLYFPPFALVFCSVAILWETVRLVWRLGLMEGYAVTIGTTEMIAEPAGRIVWCGSWSTYGFLSSRARRTFGWGLKSELKPD